MKLFNAIAAAAVIGTSFVAATPAHAFGFGGLIKAVGGAAGVAPITNVVGEVVHQEEIRNTNRMLRDNAAKAAASEQAIEAEVERRLAERLSESNSKPESVDTPATNIAQNYDESALIEMLMKSGGGNLSGSIFPAPGSWSSRGGKIRSGLYNPRKDSDCAGMPRYYEDRNGNREYTGC